MIGQQLLHSITYAVKWLFKVCVADAATGLVCELHGCTSTSISGGALLHGTCHNSWFGNLR